MRCKRLKGTDMILSEIFYGVLARYYRARDELIEQPLGGRT